MLKESNCDVIEDETKPKSRKDIRRKSAPAALNLQGDFSTNLVQKPQPLVFSMEGCKVGHILAILNHFITSMKGKWSEVTALEFSRDIQVLLDYLHLNYEEHRTSRADSMAVCLILLVGGKLGISKRDFVDCL